MSLPLIPLGLLSQGGTLAFPTLRGTAVYAGSTFDLDHDITLPAGTTTGDLVVMFGYFGGTSGTETVNMVTPSGWDRIGHLDVGTAAELNVYWRIAAGPMSSVNIENAPGETAFFTYCNAYTFSKHSHKTGFAPAVSSIASQTTANPNPPELTLPGTWGGAPHTTWLSCVYRFNTPSNTTSAHSADYSNRITTGDGALRMMSARRNLIATAENPGAWTTSASAVAIPFTLAVRGPE